MDEKQQTFEEWLADKPESIKELAKKYPPGVYKMKADAPYALSCGGTLVCLLSYKEDGNVVVVVRAKDKLPAAIEHERKMCRHHGTNFEIVTKKDIMVDIKPCFMDWYGNYPEE